jgi:hypothetical membrane protein
MSTPRLADALTLVLLRAGMLVPFLYFGLQLIAAPFYPGYSFLRNVASELGSDLARYPAPFNMGIMILGTLTLLSALGFLRALLRLRTPAIWAWLTFLAVAVNGLQSLWAGSFPMPDRRHGGHPLFVIGMVLLPFLFSVVLWKQSGALVRSFLMTTMLLIVALFPLMSGIAGLDTQSYRGLLQRLFTLAVFPPIGLGAYVLAQRLKALAAHPSPL